jgi:hypothetical protein
MTDLQQQKAVKMAIARRYVKNYSSVGRKGKDGREAQLVSACILTMSRKSYLFVKPVLRSVYLCACN